MKAKPLTVESELRRTERRVADCEGIERFMIRVQLEQLQQAEQLRRRAMLVIGSSFTPREGTNARPLIKLGPWKRFCETARSMQPFKLPPEAKRAYAKFMRDTDRSRRPRRGGKKR